MIKSAESVPAARAMWLLLLTAMLSSAEGLRIVTRSMIRTADTHSQADTSYQLVRLKEPHTNTTTTSASPPTEPTTEVVTTTEEPVVTTLQPVTTTIAASTNKPEQSRRTHLYPVARLWTDRDRSDADLWSLLHAAYLCLFSGVQCFSDRVYPMFKSYMGIRESVVQPSYYLLPRTAHEEEGESRGLLRSRLIKEVLFGLLLAQTAILPWLGGVGLASGKALVTGLLSLGAASAVAAFSPTNSYYM